MAFIRLQRPKKESEYADTSIVAQITYQSSFKLYPKLSRMTGTAKTEEKEFLKMFQMPVVEMPNKRDTELNANRH